MSEFTSESNRLKIFINTCLLFLYMKERLKMFNKKAQGLPISTLILLILGIIVLVVVAVGFIKGWDFIFGKIGILPGDLEVAAKACDVSGSNNLKTSYCNEFKEVKIAGKKQFVNCDYLEQYATFTHLLPEDSCSDTANTVRNLAEQLCDNENLKEDDKVNGETCKILNPDLYTQS